MSFISNSSRKPIQWVLWLLLAASLGYSAFFAGQAVANSGPCSGVLLQPDSSWTERFHNLLQDQDIESYMNSTAGKWVEVDGQLFHYHLRGKGDKVHLRKGGLGDSLSVALKDHNAIYDEVQKQGRRILSLEYTGQGDVEVLRAYLHGQPVIKSEDLVRNIPKALDAIAKIEGFTPDDIVSASGLSFGGQTLAGVHRYGDIADRIVLIASGVKNYNHFLLPSHVNDTIDFWRRMGNLMTGGSVQNINRQALEEFFASVAPHIADDPVLLRAKSALTMGADSVDAAHDVANIKTPTELIIVSALEDQVVPGMLHYEMAMAGLRNPNVTVRLVVVEGIGHHIPAEANNKVAKAIAKQISGPPLTADESYLIRSTGKTEELSFDEARNLLKIQSQGWWEQMESRISGKVGPFSPYLISPPADWFR